MNVAIILLCMHQSKHICRPASTVGCDSACLYMSYILTVLRLRTMPARLDVAASGFWGGRFEKAFFDEGFLTLTPPQTELCRHSSLLSVAWTREEALVWRMDTWSRTCLLCTPSYILLRWSRSLWDHLFPKAGSPACQETPLHLRHGACDGIALIWCFVLLRSDIPCLRSARSSYHHPGQIDMSAVDLAMSEGWVECD